MILKHTFFLFFWSFLKSRDRHVEFVSFFPPLKAGIEWRLGQRTDVDLELKFLLLASVLGEGPPPPPLLLSSFPSLKSKKGKVGILVRNKR